MIITPPMPPPQAQALAASLDLRALPADFYTNPYLNFCIQFFHDFSL